MPFSYSESSGDDVTEPSDRWVDFRWLLGHTSLSFGEEELAPFQTQLCRFKLGEQQQFLKEEMLTELLQCLRTKGWTHEAPLLPGPTLHLASRRCRPLPVPAPLGAPPGVNWYKMWEELEIPLVTSIFTDDSDRKKVHVESEST